MSNSLARINEILLEEDGVIGKEKIDKFNKLDVENVCFSYDSEKSVFLKDINMHVKEGDKIAIVGESGSGKSTMVKLLIGLYQVTSGNILYNSKNIDEISKKNLNNHYTRVKMLNLISNREMLITARVRFHLLDPSRI